MCVHLHAFRTMCAARSTRSFCGGTDASSTAHVENVVADAKQDEGGN